MLLAQQRWCGEFIGGNGRQMHDGWWEGKTTAHKKLYF
jgi:hypothetical protein